MEKLLSSRGSGVEVPIGKDTNFHSSVGVAMLYVDILDVDGWSGRGVRKGLKVQHLSVCPILPHAIHGTPSPSYTTYCECAPIVTFILIGFSIGTCIQILAYLPRSVEHVFREANFVADALSKVSHQSDKPQHYFHSCRLPSTVDGYFYLDKLGMPSFRRKKMTKLHEPLSFGVKSIHYELKISIRGFIVENSKSQIPPKEVRVESLNYNSMIRSSPIANEMSLALTNKILQERFDSVSNNLDNDIVLGGWKVEDFVLFLFMDTGNIFVLKKKMDPLVYGLGSLGEDPCEFKVSEGASQIRGLPPESLKFSEERKIELGYFGSSFLLMFLELCFPERVG
ncbi:hypothetical protein BC332_23249 [Capsicum chinense]|nr:hypothetical protein BC332_23249 [Capsicum chinense]